VCYVDHGYLQHDILDHGSSTLMLDYLDIGTKGLHEDSLAFFSGHIIHDAWTIMTVGDVSLTASL
jgi:hypothetical protein